MPKTTANGAADEAEAEAPAPADPPADAPPASSGGAAAASAGVDAVAGEFYAVRLCRPSGGGAPAAKDGAIFLSLRSAHKYMEDAEMEMQIDSGGEEGKEDGEEAEDEKDDGEAEEEEEEKTEEGTGGRSGGGGGGGRRGSKKPEIEAFEDVAYAVDWLLGREPGSANSNAVPALPERPAGMLCASCDACRSTKKKCDGEIPCGSCVAKYLKRHKLDSVEGVDVTLIGCAYSPAKKRGPAPGSSGRNSAQELLPPPISPQKRRLLPTAAAEAAADVSHVYGDAEAGPPLKKKRGRPTKEEAARRALAQGRTEAELEHDRVKAELGLDDYEPDKWSEKLEMLRRYRAHHGNLDIPLDYPVLGPWAERQRAAYRRARGREKRERRKQRLSSEGKGQEEEDGKEEEDEQEKGEGEKEEANASGSEDEANAASESESTKSNKSAKKASASRQTVLPSLSDEHAAELREIGFEPKKVQTKTLGSIVAGTQKTDGRKSKNDDAKWEEMFGRYKEYKKNKANDTTGTITQDAELTRWASLQRTNYKKYVDGTASSLNHDKVRRLLSSGFVLEAMKKRSFKTARFEDRLRQFIEHKNTVDPTLDPANMPPELQSWVKSTRKMATAFTAGRDRKVSMTAERMRLLEEAGFPFATVLPTKEEKVSWDERYRQLLEFRALYGHCNVPKGSHDGLGTWVRQQRGAYRNTNSGKKKLTEERARHNKMLNDIGFVWKMVK